jgi:hypothetical protein
MIENASQRNTAVEVSVQGERNKPNWTNWQIPVRSRLRHHSNRLTKPVVGRPDRVNENRNHWRYTIRSNTPTIQTVELNRVQLSWTLLPLYLLKTIIDQPVTSIQQVVLSPMVTISLLKSSGVASLEVSLQM